MPQLSILIPYNGNVTDLETTLVSVLENRPCQCEILVAHTGDYADPYEFADEVQFIEVDESSIHLGKLVTAVIRDTEASVLHLLSCGAQVSEGWTDEVLGHFDDPYLGTACPVLLDENQMILCVGVENSLLYHNRYVARNQSLNQIDYSGLEPVGPSHCAGFYRVSSLQEITCLDEFSNSLFGLEVALSLEAIGYENQVIESSIIQLSRSAISNVEPCDSQRAIWRFAGSLGLLQGIVLTVLGLATDLLSAPFSANSRKSLFSRLRNLVDLSTAKTFREFVDDAAGPAPSGQTLKINSYELPLSGSELDTSRRAA